MRSDEKQSGKVVVVLLCLIFLCSSMLAGDSPAGPKSISVADGWRVVWSDEFDQANGTPPDPGKWGYDTGGNGWGNDELEYYTPRTDNSRVEKGQLIIEARQEDFERRKFTSARLLTRGKAAWTYGRFEARIKIPRGQGVWPAFWMLGTNISTAGLPACGEIDIMENIGKEPEMVHGTLHGPGYSGGAGIGGPVKLPSGTAIADAFHVFAIECEPDHVTWLLDGRPYFAVTPATLPKNARWVFNEPKFLLLNLAIGGDWPGNPDLTTVFPQRMIVDYVRVYEKTARADFASRPKTEKN